MDISELLDTTREQKIASIATSLSSLFSTATPARETKVSRTEKVKAVKQKKRRPQRVKRRAISKATSTDDQKQEAKKSLKGATRQLVEVCGEDEDFVFRASSNPDNARCSSKNTRVCSESTADKLSSSSYCQGIQEFLLPATASSSLHRAQRDKLILFSPSRIPAGDDDPCLFDEDDIVGLAAERPASTKQHDRHEQEHITLANNNGAVKTFPIFKEHDFKTKGNLKLMQQLVANVTYDEDQSSDDGIVKDGLKKAKSFLIKNIKSFVQIAISNYSSSSK